MTTPVSPADVVELTEDVSGSPLWNRDLAPTAAAKMFGLFPKKGTIAVGSDADIVIFDPEKQQTLGVKTQHMNCDYNAYEGKQITGVVETVLSRGKVVIDKGEFKGKAGDGKFLKRGTCVAI